MIVVDVETSGVDPIKNSLLSIGAIDFNNPERTFYEECRMWDGAHANEESLAINGFTKAEIVDPSKKTEEEIIVSFFHWAEQVSEHTLAGTSPHVDLGFLRAAAQRAKINFPFAHRVIDLHSICFAHLLKRKIEPPVEKGRSGINSDFIMEYVGLPLEPRPHIGINGAIWETEAFSRLLYNQNILPQFKEYVIPWLA